MLVLTDLFRGTMTGDLKFENGFHSECLVLVFFYSFGPSETCKLETAQWRQDSWRPRMCPSSRQMGWLLLDTCDLRFVLQKIAKWICVPWAEV